MDLLRKQLQVRMLRRCMERKKTVQNFNKINEQLRVSATKADTFSAFIFPSMNFINNLGMGLVIGTGSVMVLNGMTTVGVIAAFINYSRQFSRPLSQFATLMNTIQAAVAGGERVLRLWMRYQKFKIKRRICCTKFTRACCARMFHLAMQRIKRF